jgi:hypothetical protein
VSTKILRGTIHGKTIELTGDAGLDDGQEVEIVISPVIRRKERQPGEGFLRTEGALADDPHWDSIMEEVRQARKIERRRQAEGA